MSADFSRLGIFGLISVIISSLLVNSVWSSSIGQSIFGTNPNSYLAAWVAIEALLLLALAVLDLLFGGMVENFFHWLGFGQD